MHADPNYVFNAAELPRILAEQPFTRMRRVASMLGWNGLRRHYFRVSEEDARRARMPGGIGIYYMMTDEKFNLQINTQPHGQTRLHCATVKADRCGFVPVPWHQFELPDDDAGLDALVATLRPALFRENFKNRSWRKQYTQRNPLLVYSNG